MNVSRRLEKKSYPGSISAVISRLLYLKVAEVDLFIAIFLVVGREVIRGSILLGDKALPEGKFTSRPVVRSGLKQNSLPNYV